MSVINTLKANVMQRSREKKLRQFYTNFTAGESVLDAGVSAESRRGLPARNYFLKNYRHASGSYIGLGIQDLSGMRRLFPGKSFVQYAGGRFPFGDQSFDWVFSNAVIEHVGDEKAQLLFVNEMVRVARRVFFTTPNKHFPVESHTNALFLHWSDGLFIKWCRKCKPWALGENIHLFSFRRLKQLLQDSNASVFRIRKNRYCCMSMTFSVLCMGT